MDKSDVYVVENGCMVKKRGFNFLVSKNDNTLIDLPYSKVDKIVLVGSQSITPKALEFALEKEKDILFLSQSGRLKGTIVGNSSKNIYLRLAQYELWRDKEKRLKVAKSIVSGKVKNQFELLKKYGYYDGEKEKLIQNKIKEASELNVLLGLEGEGSRYYFSKFNLIVTGELKFEKRTKHPPENEFNALLSLTYTMVLNNILSTMEKSGIDSYIGFLHTIKYGRESLALDILEQFRPCCDLAVIKWVNRGEFKKGDFRKSDEKGIVLTETGFRKYIEKFNHTLKLVNEERVEKQVKALKNVFLKEEEYKSYILQ